MSASVIQFPRSIELSLSCAVDGQVQTSSIRVPMRSFDDFIAAGDSVAEIFRTSPVLNEHFDPDEITDGDALCFASDSFFRHPRVAKEHDFASGIVGLFLMEFVEPDWEEKNEGKDAPPFGMVFDAMAGMYQLRVEVSVDGQGCSGAFEKLELPGTLAA